MTKELRKGREPVQKDEGQGSEAENTFGASWENEKSDTLHTEQTSGLEPADYTAKAMGDEPPTDWFEPLEDFDCDAEEESLAGESERSFSIAGSEKTAKRNIQASIPHRRRANQNEGWEEWPGLGEGWKRKEVIRRSGSSMGQKDVYYLSPRGDRVRSRVELISVLEGILDMTNFDYKTGKFYEGSVPPPRVRNRPKRKIRERSSSESSFMERGEGADTPDSYYSVSTNVTNSRNTTSNQLVISQSTYPNTLPSTPHGTPHDTPHGTPQGTPHSTPHGTPHGTPTTANRQAARGGPAEDTIKLPFPSSSKPLRLPSIKGEFGTEENTLVCFKCGIPFTGTWYDKQRKKPCCPTCWASKSKEHPMIRYRKWIPCGQCVGCHNSINCGQCANCKHGLSSPETRKRVCRKRRCICPIRKAPSSSTFLQQRSHIDISENNDDTSMSFQSEFADEQHPSLKSSDTENLAYNVDIDDDDDMSTDDDDDWHKKRKRRSCGECKACRCRKDCGVCDFCVDKPKFGGCNKKRQKCRLRQCQRQAMRHLLPFQMGQGEYRPEGMMLPGRAKPHYTYSRKSNFKKNQGPEVSFDLIDNQDDDDDDDNSNFQQMRWSSEPAGGSNQNDLNMTNHLSLLQPISYANFGQSNGFQQKVPLISNHDNNEPGQQSKWDVERLPPGQKPIEEEEEELPVITRIFSWDDAVVPASVESENELMKLLRSLRSSALPILWYAIMVEGPQLQLIQCSKQSVMSDTIVVIDPGFYFQIIVQKQPLLPTHTLYDNYPERLSNVTDVVNLLLGLEKYVVCQGLTPKETLPKKEPIILERAATCDFLVRKNATICVSCRTMQGL